MDCKTSSMGLCPLSLLFFMVRSCLTEQESCRIIETEENLLHQRCRNLNLTPVPHTEVNKDPTKLLKIRILWALLMGKYKEEIEGNSQNRNIK